MAKQITLEEALKLVTFYQGIDGTWRIKDVNGIVEGTVFGDIKKNVCGNICGNLYGTINGRKWQFVETPKEKLQRLIKETGNQELLEAFNRVEDN